MSDFKLSMQVASTSVTINVFIRDSTSTNSQNGLTGLVFNSAGLTAYYALPKAAAVAISLVTLAAITTAWTSGGFKEVDATNMPGWYRLDLPNAAIASGRFSSILLKGAANMVPCPVEISLEGWDNQVGTLSVGGVNNIFTTDLTNVLDSDLNFNQCLNVLLAAAAGKCDGAATTTMHYRNVATDTKNRITATVDANGNRTATSLDVT